MCVPYKIDHQPDFLFKDKFDKNAVEYNNDLMGANGWNSFDELFYILNLTSNYKGGRDFFITKLNEFGDFEWLGTINGDEDEFVHGIGVDFKGNIYACGNSMSNNLDFDTGDGVESFSRMSYQEYFFKLNDIVI